jgi:hypothetical protein
VEALDDLMREKVALVFDFLDFVGFVPEGLVRRQHLEEEAGPPLDLFGEGHEVVEEALLARDQSESHVSPPAADVSRSGSYLT